MLLLTSFFGSIIGFIVCYRTLSKLKYINNEVLMRICMINSMALAFIFAMFVELTTGSKSLAIVIPVATVCLPIVLMMKPPNVLDIVESCTATLMSVSMSVMLIGMMNPEVIWAIQCILVLIEILLYLALRKKIQI